MYCRKKSKSRSPTDGELRYVGKNKAQHVALDGPATDECGAKLSRHAIRHPVGVGPPSHPAYLHTQNFHPLLNFKDTDKSQAESIHCCLSEVDNVSRYYGTK